MSPRESSAQVPAEDIVHLPGVLAPLFDIPRSVARRLLAQGAVKIDGEVVDWLEGVDLPAGQVFGHWIDCGAVGRYLPSLEGGR